jgi:predicted O-linked N-acetylglucosamine transferase (SPINDLY family)
MSLKFLQLFRPKATKDASSATQRAKFEHACLLSRQSQLAEAADTCQEILDLQPDHFDSLALLAEIAAKLDNKDQAIGLYTRVINLRPDHAVAYYKRGNLLKDRNQAELALASYDQAIGLDPSYGNAFCNRGAVLALLNRPDEALESYNRAIELNPTDALAHYNRANLLKDRNLTDAALASYDQAVAVDPNYANAFCNRGAVLGLLNRPEEALASYNRAIELNPRDALAYYNRGDVLRVLKRLNEALASYDEAISVRPDYAEAYCNRGVLLQELDELDAALICYDRCIEINSGILQAHLNRGQVLVRMKQFVAAIASYERAMALKPDSRFLLGTLRHAKMYICDWAGLELDIDRLAAGIEANAPVSAPMPILGLLSSLQLQRKAAEIWVREECAADDSLGEIAPRPPSDKIRIGYFSADFRNHPVSLLTAELFETHDRSRFEIIAFAFGPKVEDAVRARLERAFDRFIDVGEQSDLEVAETARRMGIDIAVDLGGFTERARTKIFALRAAPVQMSYIGYLGTMGAPYMDYLLADPTIIPVEEQHSYSEAIIYLPSYQVNDSKRPVVERTLTRAELGLPETGFVFSCFNANYKITPATFAVWMRILQRVQGSSFFLYAGNEVAERNLRKEAHRCGVESHRLVFGKYLAQEDYLARFRAMDLFLDTLPYNAGTTASDALWAGLPVLTCAGRAFAGRVAASLLNAIELPELVTSTAAQYEEMAVQLAENPQQLAQIKQKLAQNRLTTALFDTRAFTRHLEVAYTMVDERRCAGLVPQTIFVIPET